MASSAAAVVVEIKKEEQTEPIEKKKEKKEPKRKRSSEKKQAAEEGAAKMFEHLAELPAERYPPAVVKRDREVMKDESKQSKQRKTDRVQTPDAVIEEKKKDSETPKEPAQKKPRALKHSELSDAIHQQLYRSDPFYRFKFSAIGGAAGAIVAFVWAPKILASFYV